MTGLHFHRWGNWEDVALEDETKPPAVSHNIILLRQRIRQKRRCSICNKLETRAA